MRLEKSLYDRVGHLLSMLALLGATIFLALYWNQFPNQIPSHYNAAGEIDGMSSKTHLIIFVVIGWSLFVLMSVVENFPQIWNTGVQVTEENKERIYRVLKDLLTTIKLLLAFVFAYLTVQASSGENLPALFLPVFLSALLGSMLFFVLKLFRVQ
ncbi:DUF1648 domain-containing protein [Aminipila butyrica]|uniref:DUF1648 domain-containing protein n=1 Tax=Aminipila butyrica TaxID=433296 RepID=A0A858BX99_9FIRM|nr:DUF1648 domain-containing protein [Aminipila butyrica]QIB69520.1 DUF1648 domain-containing protein [Aminipila butyrica]